MSKKKKVITYPYVKCSVCHEGFCVCENIKAYTYEEGLVIKCFNCWYKEEKLELQIDKLEAEKKLLKDLVERGMGV